MVVWVTLEIRKGKHNFSIQYQMKVTFFSVSKLPSNSIFYKMKNIISNFNNHTYVSGNVPVEI